MIYERIMVFGAHPDDEIAMARTIAKLSASGTDVTVVIMTDGCEGYNQPDMREAIVATRAREARACDRVLGIATHINLGLPDMGLRDDKETVQRLISIIREHRPDAVFTHGPSDPHRDHVTTSRVTKSACFHAGEPVALALGAPWRPRFVYYHKGVDRALPRIFVDVTEFREKRLEAEATQKSQYAVFRKSASDFDADIASRRADRSPCFDCFWLAEWNRFQTLLPSGLEAPDNYYGERA